MKQLRKKENFDGNQVPHSLDNAIYIILFSFTFFLYSNTLSNNYALDDSMVITQNNFVKEGVAGIGDIFSKNSTKGFTQQDNLLVGGRYRPFSIATLALEYELFGLNPHISHLINIILYFITALILYRILKRLFPVNNNTKILKGKYVYFFSIPFLSTMLFIAHPIHTEVVSNIKGRDEILALLGSLLSLYSLIKYYDNLKIRYLIYSFLSFFIALLSKESAIAFVIIIPFTFYFFFNRNLLKVLMTLLSAAFLFLIIRNSVLGTFKTQIVDELMNNPFMGASISQKYATIFYTLGLYLKLLLFPHPLTCDYYPYHIPIINFFSLKSLLPLLIYIFIIVYAILTFKKRSIFSYSIILYLVPLFLVSNLIFPIGTFMNERFLYVPSIGFFIACSYLLINKLPVIIKKQMVHKNIFYSILIITFSLYSFKTITRNKVWKNDFELFSHDIQVSGNSAFSNDALGRQYYFKARLSKDEKEKNEYAGKAIYYLESAVRIHPKYYDALLLLGNSYYEFNKNFEKTYKCYYQLLKLWPKNDIVLNNILGVLNTKQDIDYKLARYIELDSLLKNNYTIKYNIGIIYGRNKEDYLKAEYYLEESVKLNRNNFNSLSDLGVVYLRLNKFTEAIKILNEALKLEPNNKVAIQNLSLAYSKSGNLNKL